MVKKNYYITNSTTLYSIVDDINIVLPDDKIVKKLIKSFKSSLEVSFDTETDGLNFNAKCLLLQFGNKENNVVLDVNIIHSYVGEFFLSLLSNPAICKVGVNLKYDYKIILTNFGIRLVNVYDCMLAELCIRGGKPTTATAQFIINKYVGVWIDKQLGADFAKKNRITISHIKYSINDVTYLDIVKEKQLVSIKKLDLENLIELENEVLFAISEMEINGIKLDSNRWIKAYKENKLELETLAFELDDEFLKFDIIKNTTVTRLSLFEEYKVRKLNINYDSPLQLLNILKKIGLNVDATNKPSLIPFRNDKKYGEVVNKVIEYSEKEKECSTYGDKFLDQYLIYSDSRLRSDFWQILETGRISSSRPNLQNIPRDNKYRNCFISEKGWSLVSTDFKQQELRVLAALSKDEVWIKAFEDGLDLHTELCIKTFGIDKSEVKDVFPLNPTFTYRDVQKTINFGLAFGMSAFKLANTLNILKEKAQELINTYFSAVPDVEKFLNLCGGFALKNRYIRTARPYRRLRWLSKNPNLTFKEEISFTNIGKNTPIQGTAADMVKLALILIYRKIVSEGLDNKVRVVLQVHDDIICEVRDDFVEEWGAIQENLMKEAAKSIIDNVPFESDLVIMKTWNK